MSNVILQITLLETKDPMVIRLLSVPTDLTFLELHNVIEASFGWRKEDGKNERDDEVSFSVVDGHPQHHDRPKLMSIVLELLAWTVNPHFDEILIDDIAIRHVEGGYNWKRRSCHTTKLYQVFGDLHYREKSMIYDYHHGLLHSLKVQGTSAHSTGGKTLCLGGQGHITKRAWFLGRRSDDDDLIHGCRSSTWVIDMDDVVARVNAVEEERLARKAAPTIKRESEDAP